MGKIICEKHGGQGIVFACEHVRQHMLTGAPTVECVVTGRHEIGSLKNETIAVQFGYCDSCAKQHGLPLIDADLPALPADFDAQTNPVCGACFDELKRSLRSCESA